MMKQATIDQLKAMKFTAMANAFAAQGADPATYGQMGFEERFGLLVDAEWNRRQQNKLRSRIQEARLDTPSAVMEGIEYLEDRKIDKGLLLRLSNCAYIDEGHHIILSGASGCGKSYIACALGNAACRKFYHVRYTRMRNLLDEMNLARTEDRCKKAVKALAKADLLILDDWLLQPLTPQEVYDLLELVEARTKHGATIFCTQYETDDWYVRLNPTPGDDSPVTDAIMDRIVHNVYLIPLEGKSMRERHGLAATGKDGAET